MFFKNEGDLFLILRGAYFSLHLQVKTSFPCLKMIKTRYYIWPVFVFFALISCVGKSDRLDWAQSCFDKGIAFEEVSMFDSAAVCYLSAIGSLDPDEEVYAEALGAYYNRIALLLFKSEINKEAEKLFEKAIAYNSRLSEKSQLSESYRGLWKCYCVDKGGILDSTLLKTVRLIPDIRDKEELFKAKNALAYYFLMSGDYASAMQYSSELEALSPDTVSYYKSCLVRGSIFYASGQLDSALVYTRKAACSNYIYTRASAYENLYEMTGDNLYRDRYDQLNDSIAGLMKPAKVNTAFYGELIHNMDMEYARKIHTFLWLGGIGALIVVVVIVVVLLLYFRRRNVALRSGLESESQTPGIVGGTSEAPLEMEKKSETLQREIVEQIKMVTAQKNKRFVKSEVFKQTVVHIEGGTVFLTPALRDSLFESLRKEYALLHRLLTTYFSFSDEEFYFFCLSSLGLSTKECAACRCVSMSAIRVLRKRVNDKMRRYITIDALFQAVKL